MYSTCYYIVSFSFNFIALITFRSSLDFLLSISLRFSFHFKFLTNSSRIYKSQNQFISRILEFLNSIISKKSFMSQCVMIPRSHLNPSIYIYKYKYNSKEWIFGESLRQFTSNVKSTWGQTVVLGIPWLQVKLNRQGGILMNVSNQSLHDNELFLMSWCCQTSIHRSYGGNISLPRCLERPFTCLHMIYLHRHCDLQHDDSHKHLDCFRWWKWSDSSKRRSKLIK